MASGGCRKAAFYTAIGCLAIPIAIALLIGGVLLVGQRVGRNGPQHPVPSNFTVPVAAPAATPSPTSAGGHGSTSGPATPGKDLPQIAEGGAPATGVKPLHLSLDLTEGNFTIVPGPPGSDIKVDGLFDPASYELTQMTEEAGEAGREVKIGFHRKSPFFFMMLSSSHPDNRITITLPEGVPTALDLHLARCESHVELGGLTLTNVQARLSMGDQLVNFGRPVVGRLQDVSMRLAMGDIKVRGLGNAHPENVEIHGSMGDIRVSFDGAWPAGGKIAANVRMSMGDFRVTVPSGVRLKSSSVLVMGESRTPGAREQPDDPNAPLLELQTHASMGGLEIIRE
jgi:hypothetical protein